jgi:hypothetical protein
MRTEIVAPRKYRPVGQWDGRESWAAARIPHRAVVGKISDRLHFQGVAEIMAKLAFDKCSSIRYKLHNRSGQFSELFGKVIEPQIL